jgi:hypothetical protein
MVDPCSCLPAGVWDDPGARASAGRRCAHTSPPVDPVGFAADFAGFPPIFGVMFLVRQETGG